VVKFPKDKKDQSESCQLVVGEAEFRKQRARL